MNTEERRVLRLQRWRIAMWVALYAIVAGLWVALSDRLVAVLATGPDGPMRLQTANGWVFVAGTAVLLAVVLHYEARAREVRDRTLQESDDLHRTLVDVASDAVVLIDNATGRILAANPAAAALYGYTQGELLERRNTDLSAEPAETARVTAHTPLAPDTVVRIPLRYHRKRDGTVFPVEITGRFFAWRGRPVHLACIRDITARQQTEATLARYRLLAEQARDIVLFVRRDGRLLEANRAAVLAYGYTVEEFAALHIQDLRAPDTHGLTAEQMAQADAQGILFETVHRRKDGTTFPVEVSSRGTDVGGERVLLSVVRDITERRRAQQVLEARTRQVEAVRAVTADIVRELDLSRLLRLLIARAAELVGATTGTVYLWEPATQRLVPGAWHGLGDWQGTLALRLGEAVAGTAAQTRRTLVVNDYRTSSFAHPLSLERTALTASLGEPLVYRDELVGAMTLGHVEGRTFTERDAEVLRLLADQAAIAIQNARLYDAARRELRQRKAAEAELRKIVRAVEQSPTIVVITDLTGAIEYVNPKFTEITGYTFDEVRGRNPRILKSGHTSAEEYAQLWTTLLAGKEWRGEFRNRRKDGTLYWEAASISPVRDAEGAVTHLVAVKEDISADKAADTALRRYASQLEALRATTTDITRELNLARLLTLFIERAVKLLEGVSGVVYLLDAGTETIAARAWVGQEDWVGEVRLRVGQGIAGTVVERRAGIIENAYRTSPHAVPVFLERTRIAAVLAEPLVYRDRIIGAVLVNRLEGTFAPQDAELLRPFADQAAIAIENARLYAATQEALADLRQVQEELVRSEKLRALGQMAAGIAHDLNNTLATVLGQAELLRLRTRSPEIQEGLQILQTAAADGAEIVRRLQDFARQRGAGPLHACELAQLVSEALEITRPRWQEEPRRRGVRIETATDLAALSPVHGNPAEIREVLTNLIFNAVDAMPYGGQLRFTGRVTADSTENRPLETPRAPARSDAASDPLPDAWVELAVEDTGIGMTEAVRGRIFDPFFTTKGLHGTGLGLSVVYGIMERHGGQIEVTSAPGRGTTFRLRFRRAAVGAAAPAGATPIRASIRRVLIVDDDTWVLQTLAGLLRTSGHDVLEADGGAAATERLAQHPVDIVFTDLGMPDVNGWDVARAAKAFRPDLPVVLLTGWGDQAGTERPPDVHVDRILTKPVPRSVLLSVIAELVRPAPPDPAPESDATGSGVGADGEQRGADPGSPDGATRGSPTP
jgi:PAS domain S-box-containing protein